MHFASSQKFQIKNGHAVFYTTAEDIRQKAASLLPVNYAINLALTALENAQTIAAGVIEIGVIWNGMNIKIEQVPEREKANGKTFSL